MKQHPPFTIIYEDNHITAVNKAAGIAVSGDRWDESRERLDKLLGSFYKSPIFIVHRLDRDTSGLIVFARDEGAHRYLSKAFESRDVEKIYYAVVHARPIWAETCTVQCA